MGDRPPTCGVILAGGLGRRMGGDKALVELGGISLLGHVLARLRAQVSRVILNANGDPARFGASGLTVVPDGMPGHPGPLAGILSGLDWVAAEAPEIAWLASVPVDTPFVPLDLVSRLHAARGTDDSHIVLAAWGGRTHPVAGLWPVALRHTLRTALVQGVRKVSAFTDIHAGTVAAWPDSGYDPFLNINTPEDRARAEALLRPIE